MATLSRRTEAQSARRVAAESALMEAVERLLDEGAAYADLSVDRIARAAGLSRTAFYLHFADKRELLMRLTEATADALYAEAEGWWGGATSSAADAGGPERLAEALRAVVGVYAEHGVLLRAVVEAAAYDEPVAGFWRAVVGRFVDATRDRIEAEQRAGRAAGLDAAGVAFALAWMTERVVYEHSRAPQERSEAELVDALRSVWVRTIYG